ncbi:hypothetical protein ABGB17_11360 [Sphaerisporangium sp. B11E5]|uniref:dTMP kinase n=1 Tax=Sphaerisporangium sp. B11E5 TaxID=3153563 RepID=UPI00325E73D1
MSTGGVTRGRNGAAGAAVMAQGRFMVLAGIDGSGKSSVLSRLDVHGLLTTNWCELRGHQETAALAPRNPTGVKNRLPPLSRAMFIGGHLVAQYEQLVRPSVEAGHSVLLDSYYYKVLAKELVLRASHPSLAELCAELPEPDCVIFVDVPPQVSFRRKDGRVSSYERFMRDSPHQDYVTFQSMVRDIIMRRVTEVPDHHIVDGDKPLSEVLESVRAIAESRLHRSTRSDDAAEPCP